MTKIYTSLKKTATQKELDDILCANDNEYSARVSVLYTVSSLSGSIYSTSLSHCNSTSSISSYYYYLSRDVSHGLPYKRLIHYSMRI